MHQIPAEKLTFCTDASCEATQDEVVDVHVSAHHTFID